ncbi:MAG: MAPEG family protein [Xanthomonadales bacterium]|nr:MAPEG family protein [Xanthomonadales bacterium]
MRITAIYVALSVLLVLVLAARVSLGRYRARVGLGSGGDEDLLRRIRVHANALENLPLALLLLLMLDLAELQPLWLHLFGIVLILGRILHAIGLSRSGGASFGRATGTALTWGVMALMALLVLLQVVLRAQL